MKRTEEEISLQLWPLGHEFSLMTLILNISLLVDGIGSRAAAEEAGLWKFAGFLNLVGNTREEEDVEEDDRREI